MPYLDLLIAIAILVFAGKGFVKGFFVEVLTFVGFFVALFVTANLYKPIGEWIASFLSLNPKILSVIAFVALFVLITFAFSFVGNMLTKATKKLKLSGLNRFFGFVFGAAKGAFIGGILLAVILEKGISATIKAQAKDSILAPPLVDFANWLLAVLDIGFLK